MKKPKDKSWFPTWMGAFYAIVFALLAYLIVGTATLEDGSRVTVDHLSAALFVAMVWVVMMTVFSTGVAFRGLTYNTAWWRTLLHGVAFIVGVLGCLLGTVLLVVSVSPDSPMDEETMRVFPWLIGAAIAFFVLMHVIVWSRPVVQRDTILVFRGRIYYPGEVFKMHPFARLSPTAYSRDITVRTTVQATFSEYTDAVDALAVVQLDIERAREDGVREFTLTRDEFMATVKDGVRHHAEALIITRGVRALFNRQPTTSVMRFPASFPVLWDGRATYTATG